MIPLTLLVAASVPAGCGGAATSAPPRHRHLVRSGPATTTTLRHPADADVRRAYLAEWEAYARAAWRLDATGLERWAADAELAALEHEIDQRVRQRRRSRVRVTHDITVAVLGPEHAAVTDRLLNESVAVDADTGRELEQVPHEPQYWQFALERKAGTWKVVYSVRS